MLPRHLNRPTRSSQFSQWLARLFPPARRSAVAPMGAEHGLLFERLEDRVLLDAVLLGTDPLVFDPTPNDASSGDEVTIGTITYELENVSDIKVTYSIDASNQAAYDLAAVETKINAGSLGTQTNTGLAENTESYSHTFSLTLPLPPSVSELDIDACATIDSRNADALDAALPTVATVRVNTDGNIIPPSSYFDTIISPGFIPSSTDVGADTVTFTTDPGWATGDAVRVVAAFGAGATGLVTPPVATDTTTSATYYLRNLGGNIYSFHTTYLNATTGASPADIIAPIPTTGEIVIVGENDTLPFLGQVPLNESLVPASTDFGTAESVTFAIDPGWATGTAVRVWDGGNGLSANTTYFVRNLGGAYSFYNSVVYATAGTATGRSNLTGPITDSIFANLTTLSFEEPHGWLTGAVVRATASGGGLTLGTNYYVRAIDADTISLHTTLANAQGNLSPVTFTAPITSVISPMFNGWCVDNDRFIAGNEYVVNVYSSYEASSFPDTTFHPKEQFGTDAGLLPVNTSATPSSTDYTTNERATFTTTSSLGWADNQAVRVANTTAGGALVAGTTYYIDVVSSSATSTVVSFHTATPVGAGNKVNLLGDVTEAVFRTESIDFAVTTNWPNGTKIKVDVDDGGLLASATYYARQQNVVGGTADNNSISLYDTRAHAIAGGTTGLITLTNPIESTTKFYVPENLVENPENLDVMNWVLNQNFHLQLAAGSMPTATNTNTSTAQVPASTIFTNTGLVPSATDITAAVETVDFAGAHGWATGDVVRVSTSGGGLTAGTNYFARAIDSDTISFYDTAAHAIAGGTTGLKDLTASVTGTVYKVDLASTDDTVAFNPGHGFATGDAVNVSANVGGLSSNTTYFLYNVSGDTFSFHTAAAATAANKVNLTADITASVRVQDDSITVPAEASPSNTWATGMVVQVSATGGGLTAGTDYFIRELTTTATTSTLAFYNTAADANNNVNRIDLTAPITATVRPYYTEGDVQRTVWELIENNPGNPGYSAARVAEILAAAVAAGVPLNDSSIDFIPGCEGTVALILQPFEVDQASNEQITIAQITVATVPNFCVEGENCQQLIVTLGTIGDTVWLDTNSNGLQDETGTGIAGVTINLLDGSGNQIGTGYTTTTDANGNYQFTGLLPGTYTVEFVAPSGKVFTAQDAGTDDTIDSDANPADGKTGTYTLAYTLETATVESDLTVDAGYFEPATISGVKFYDANGNGVWDDAGVVADWTIYLDNDIDLTNGVLATGLTDGFGEFEFTGLASGTYYVYEETRADWVQTKGGTSANGSYEVAVPPGATTGIEFGNLLLEGGSGGRTLGFWSNKNGQLVIADDGGAGSELAALSTLNLVQNSLTGKSITDGVAFDPTSYAALRTWLLNANATNMAYMLSAQLTATALAVEAGFLLAAQVVDTGNILDGFYARINADLNAVYNTTDFIYVTEFDGHAFITIENLMAAANYELGLDDYTLSGDVNRDVQEALKNTLDAINNNTLSFVA